MRPQHVNCILHRIRYNGILIVWWLSLPILVALQLGCEHIDDAYRQEITIDLDLFKTDEMGSSRREFWRQIDLECLEEWQRVNIIERSSPPWFRPVVGLPGRDLIRKVSIPKDGEQTDPDKQELPPLFSNVVLSIEMTQTTAYFRETYTVWVTVSFDHSGISERMEFTSAITFVSYIRSDLESWKQRFADATVRSLDWIARHYERKYPAANR